MADGLKIVAVADVTDGVPALETPSELWADDIDPEVNVEDVVGRVPVLKVPGGLGLDEARVGPDAEFDPGPTGKVIEDVPGPSPPPPGSPVIDGFTVNVAVGKTVMVMTIVVGPLKMMVLPSPKMSICVGPGM